MIQLFVAGMSVFALAAMLAALDVLDRRGARRQSTMSSRGVSRIRA